MGGLRSFRPFLGTGGGHRQTLLGYLLRRSMRWTLPSEDLIVESKDGERLLVRASFQEQAREKSPALVLVHGLGGSDASGYLVAAGLLAYRRGYHVLRMNMRGAGDSEGLCRGLYNAGLDQDLLSVLERAAGETPAVAAAGFSLGASLMLLTLGRRREALPKAVFGAAAVSPPLSLRACALALERGGNRLYAAHFMGGLRRSYRRKQQVLPSLYEARLEAGTRTVFEFDDLITARYGGYTGAEDYYERSSAGPWLSRIDRPTLVLAAQDDPMIPIESILPFASSGAVTREYSRTGGHVGFLGEAEAPGHFWAAERILSFLGDHLPHGKGGPA
jgi:predicted alpha/beta-fold hydrolase